MILEGKTREAVKLAAQMLVDHDLGDWRLDLRNVTSYHAMVLHTEKVLVINTRYITVSTKDHFTGTIYHEIAHALLGISHGHDRTFRDKVFELTGSYDNASYSSKANIRNMLTYCERCGDIGSTNKNIKLWCNICFKSKQLSILKKKPNPLKEVKW